MKCPYYRKVSVENYPYGCKSYCEGDRLKGLRAPSLFEETHYCKTAQYPACRVFQARQGYSEHEDVPKPSHTR
jgi:hypothetical protein